MSGGGGGGEPPGGVVCVGDLYYNIYRPSGTTNEQIYAAIVEASKDFVFEAPSGLALSPKGYSGVPLYGKVPLSTKPDDLWKIIEILFKLSGSFPGLLFSISTDDPALNPLYVEAEKNEVFPKGLTGAGDFNNRVYGAGGVLHVVTDAVKAAHPNVLHVDIVRQFGKETRNILLTEAVMSRVNEGTARHFGMHRIGVNLPEQIAYIARQRPDLLSNAIQEYKAFRGKHEDAELIVEASTRVMVHVHLNDREWKVVNQIAEIHEPLDIVSHRVSLAMIDFDRKYSNAENGEAAVPDHTFSHIGDEFERERLCSLAAQLRGERLSLAHLYQSAKALITEKHVNLCYNLYQDGVYSSDGGMSTFTADEEEKTRRTRKKKTHASAKKRTLAAVPTRSIDAPDSPIPSEDERNPSSGHLNSFERAVNGYDAYKASSPERSLGEDEEMSMFAARSKNNQKKKKHHKRAQLSTTSSVLGESMMSSKRPSPPSDDDGFELSELLNAAPPLAENDDFDEI